MTVVAPLISTGLSRAREWMASQNREAFEFQLQAWREYLAGRSGLIQAPTGMGKTVAAALGPMIEAVDEPRVHGIAPLKILWITPLRALAADTVASLQLAAAGMELPWTVELRTGDTTATVRKRQQTRLPAILVTTPESLSLLLSYELTLAKLATVRCVVVDEWHDLMASKRGVQVELALARLNTLQPSVRIWGLSATIADAPAAAATLLGPQMAADAAMISASDEKKVGLTSILPPKIERFSWAGHLGIQLVEQVAEAVENSQSSLIFTNTRSHSELWFAALLKARPNWLGKIAVHHGSLDRKLRLTVQQMLHDGLLKAVVCTSSLDLGVDFWPVDQVIQIGSPKSVARALQRAGRSGHQPGAISQLVCVPTQAMELVEFSAARYAMQRRMVERIEPIRLPLDVLAQHLVTVAAGGGFVETELLAEVRCCAAFSALTEQQWRWVMDFAERGGPSLLAYPHFSRITQINGRWVCSSDRIAKMHRMNIGTIAADGAIAVQFVGGKRLGSVEESFIAKMKRGDVFTFAGRQLELVRVHDMTAQVRLSRAKKADVPRWMGGRMPLSASLAEAVRLRLDEVADGRFVDEEMRHIEPILRLQQRWSAVPRHNELLIETSQTREGNHHFLFPFQGRLVHEGLAALLVYRLGQSQKIPVTATFNDYGIELMSPAKLAEGDAAWRAALSPKNLLEDVIACVNSGELARRHFREIARIAGLLVPQRPGGSRTTRQLQASSSLFFDVFREFDPENLLLQQAQREVLERQLEIRRLQRATERIADQQLLATFPGKLSPLAFPLWAERIASQQLRLEGAADRIERIASQLERAAVWEES